MNDGLVLQLLLLLLLQLICLNPYCSGRWSRTTNNGSVSVRFTVLILVIVDDGFVHDGNHMLIIHEQGS